MTTTPEELDPTADSSDDATEAHGAIEVTAAAAATRSQVRREQRRLLLRSPAFIIGSLIVGFWILASFFPDLLSSWGPKESVVDNAGEAFAAHSP